MRRFALLLLAGCSSSVTPPPPSSDQPSGWSDELAMPEAIDLDPDPSIIRVDLTAKTATLSIGLDHLARGLWTFNGSVPGPLIRARPGDRLIVRAQNELHVPLTIHWHGMRVPADQDGVPHHSQREVSPGDIFDYSFIVPDAGLYWYHPHVMSAAEVGFGLYGAIVVEDPAEDPVTKDELVLVLSDLALRADGALDPADAGGDLGTLFGREGKHLLANGRVNPVLEARANAPQRWRIVNAAKSRYYQLELAGHKFTVLGGDGGRAEYPIEVDRLLLIPGQRREVIVVPTGADGEELHVRWIPYDRGYGSTEFRDAETIFRVRIEGASDKAFAVPELRREIEPIDPTSAIDVNLLLSKVSGPNEALVLGINGLPAWDAPPIVASIGDTHRFVIDNDMDWAHPFHLHGFFFQVLGASGPRVWTDTVDVPVKGHVEVLVRYDDRPGMWMFHCHVLDHADAGMMGMLQLEQ